MRSHLELVLEGFDCYGTWLPGTQVAGGRDRQARRRGSFSHTGWLKDRAKGLVIPEELTMKEPPQHAMAGAIVTRSGGGTLAASQIVNTLADASASVTLKMSKHNSAALVLEDVERTQFSDERPVRHLMNAMLAAGRMDLDEVLVTYVLKADSGVVVASSASEAAAEADTDIDVGVMQFQLAKVGGRLEIVSGETSDTVAVAEDGRPLTPMYRALFFHGSRAWWRFWRKVYSIEGLVQSASALGGLGMNRPAHAWAPAVTAASVRPFAYSAPFRTIGTGLPGDAATAVSYTSRPSLALADHALRELSGLASVEPSLGLMQEPLEAEPLYGTGPNVVLAGLHQNLASVLREKGDLEGAQTEFQRAIEVAEGAWTPDATAESADVADTAETARPSQRKA